LGPHHGGRPIPTCPSTRVEVPLRGARGLTFLTQLVDYLRNRLPSRSMPLMNPRVSDQVQPASDWNPSLYMKFEDERTLAARDLLARVPLASARRVYDLGCGPGNSAELLSRRFPDADITGLDTSEAMLNTARTRAPRARFVKQNIADWVPSEQPNLIFANAALHFLSDHHALFPRLAATLAPGGVFAAQMPSTARESSHALMRMVARRGLGRPDWCRSPRPSP
jgi:trans-aconitate 2-methyltransferase